MQVTFSVCLIGFVLLAATAREIVRQDPERERLETFLERYYALIDNYREGHDLTVIELIDWDRKRLTDVVGAVPRPARPWDEARFKTAAMLHTDVAINAIEADETLAAFHLQLASRLLFNGGPGLHPFARTWYVTVTRVLRDRARPLLAASLLEQGRRYLPSDATVLYESAVLEEQIATYSAFVTETTVPGSPFPTSASHGGRNLAGPSGPSKDRTLIEWRNATDNAARWLHETLKLDPANEQAQLHLGRVQALRANHTEASVLLERLAVSTADPNTAYLATMFLGAMHERREHYDDAERAYRQAVARLPAAQSAYLALSEVLQKRGRGDESRQVLTNLLQQSDSRTEPWWWYLVDPRGDVRRRIDALRETVRK